jgi:hypothetical protein
LKRSTTKGIEGIKLLSYPCRSKINVFIEWYNRTVQKEFINNQLDTIYDNKINKILFTQELADYLIFYNI